MLKALFLDRDGIINIDHGYVYQQEAFEFSPALFELLHIFVQKSYKIFVVTNQSGIGRGYYTEEDFHSLSQWMTEAFLQQGIVIEQIAFCPHLPTDNCACRKPQTGMIDTLLEAHDIDLNQSYMIGDKQSDIDLARNAHIKHAIAISPTPLVGADHTFKSIQAYKEYLDENPAKIR